MISVRVGFYFKDKVLDVVEVEIVVLVCIC